MKRIILTFLFISLFFALHDNSNAQSIEPDLSKIKTVKPIQPQNPSIPLIDYIRRLPGVLVMNQGGVTKVQLRGSNSLLGDSSPLFVVDGRYISSFSQLENTIDVNDIGNINVLKGPESGTRYGLRGSNGAIIISTK